MGKNYFLRFFILSTLFIGMGFSALGQNVSYLEFDGNDDYVRYSYDSKLGGLNGAKNYTLESWVYIPTGAATGGNILRRSTQFGVYYTTNNRLAFYVTDGSNSGTYYTNNNTLSNDVWHHIAIVRNTYLTHYLHIYIDGVDQINGNYNGYQLKSSVTKNLYIGNNGNSNYYFMGYIDEIRLSAAATSSTNLHSNTYDNEYTTNSYTKALLHFNEGTGTTTTNEASSATITLKNGVTWRTWNYQTNYHLPLAHEWNGATNTDWNTTNNWVGGTPSATNDVLIPYITNQPTISSGNTADCHNLLIESSASVTIAGTLNIGGDFINDGTFAATGTVKFNGSDEQQIPAGTYNKLDIDNSSAANCTFAGNVLIGDTLNIAGNITIQNGNNLDCNGAITTTGDCYIYNLGTIYIGSTFNQNGGYNGNTGLVVFDGISAQTIPADDYYNLEINNSNGVSLGGITSVNGSLTLTNGIITTTTTNILTINDGGTVSSGSNTAYIDGPIAKVGSGNFIFPVGNGGKWARIGISSLSASETFTAEYHKDTHSGTSSLTSPLTDVSNSEWWQLDRDGSATADITLYWEDSKWSGIGDMNDLRIAHWNGSSWESETGTYSSTGSADLNSVQAGSIKVTGVSSFSPFSFGTINNVTNTLPIELISFDLTKNNNQTVTLNWVTASEINNSGFEIQRSVDAEHWEKLTFIKGAGNSNELRSYSFIDQQPEKSNYYRLKQIDFDGGFSYSTILNASFTSTNSLNIYPNPVGGLLTISGIDKGNVQWIYLYDYMGKLIRKYDASSSTINTENLDNGVYFIKVLYKNNETESKQFIKQ